MVYSSPPAGKTLRISKDEEILLIDILENPEISITEHYKQSGLNSRAGNKAKESLITKEFIKEESIVSPKGMKKLLKLTDKGKNYLNIMGIEAEKDSQANISEHEIWKKEIKKHFEEQGFNVEEEVLLPD